MSDSVTTEQPGMDDGGVGAADEEARSVRELLHDRPHVAMVGTVVDGHPSSRPVTCVDVTDHRMSFLVNRQHPWVQAIADNRAVVHVTVADHSSNVHLALNGQALVVHDGREIERLWNPAARAFFDGPDDPDVAVLHFDVSDGEYWDGPSGRLGRAVALLRAAWGGDEDTVATQGPVLGDEAV